MKLLLIFVLCMLKPVQNQDPGLVEIRQLFLLAPANRDAAEKLVALLSKIDSTSSSPVLVCYKGAGEMIRAKYVANPFHKLSFFNDGKTLIESAVRRDPGNLEIRFIRFSIQTNLPSFLGYNASITEDKKSLLDNINSLTDTSLRVKINNYLSASNYCTADDLKNIKKW